MLNGPGLVRRSREMVALMARERAPMACVVFAVPPAAGASWPASVVAGAARISDIVGVLDAGHYALVAPATGEIGVVRLAVRVGAALRAVHRSDGPGDGEPWVRAGYHVVGNVGYQPLDSVELLRRAAAALEEGVADPVYSWLRRYDAGWP